MPKVPPLIDSAVLVPLYRDGGGEIRLVLVRRTEWGVHGGQLALPGGTPIAADGSLRETALREAREEIGLPPQRVDLLAELPLVDVVSTGFRIFPFLARIVPPGTWRLDRREIAELLEVPVSDLARPGAQQHGVEATRGTPFYQLGPYRLWGATYRIVCPLVPRVLAGEWEV